MGLVGKVLAHVRKGGIGGLARASAHRLIDSYRDWSDASLDRRYGIDTRASPSLVVPETWGPGPYPYEPVTIAMFRAILRAAAIRPAERLFVDYGSGKGRALVLAAEHGFKRVIGLELDPALHSVALENVRKFVRRRPGASPIDLCCADAAGFELPDEEAMLFFNNPFGEVVLRQVCDNIERCWRRRMRPLLIAYRHPVHAAVFDQAGFLRRVSGQRSFVIYRAAPPVTL